jgi:hypothetical protein
MSTADRVIPSTCPSCGGLLAAHYATHCDKWCGWIRHAVVDCGVVIDTRSGRHMEARK